MISKKDNLLKRPWQQRKFDNHRRKVESALPAIDTHPPLYGSHVKVKLKKIQKEQERSQQINYENFLLLQKLNYITRTSRVDNTWKNPQPNFLNRVPMYSIVIPQIEELVNEDFIDYDNLTRSKCSACSPKKHISKAEEERILWEDIEKPATRVRSKSVPVRKTNALPVIKNNSATPQRKTELLNPEFAKTKVLRHLNTQPQNIILTRGCLKLSLNFPSDTVVKYQEGHTEKFLAKGVCYCKTSPSDFI